VVRRVELHGGLGGSHFHNPAAFGFNKPGRQLHGFSFTQDVIMVVAVHFRLQLLDTFPDAGRFIEVHQCALERLDLASGNQFAVCRSVTFGRYPQNVIQAVSPASQVPVSMVGNIRDRGFVGLSFIVNSKFAVVR